MMELPDDVVASLIAIGRVEWGRSFQQPDEKHVSDFADTLRITREHFGTEGDTAVHGLYLEGQNTVLCHTGTSPNSPQHARILAGAWNQLVALAEAQKEVEDDRGPSAAADLSTVLDAVPVTRKTNTEGGNGNA